MADWLESPVLLGITLLTTGVMATEDPIVGVIAAGASAGGLLFLLFVVITVYCLVKQSRKAKKEVKLSKPYANGTVRHKSRVVPQQFHYQQFHNPVFHTQGPPFRSRPPITFYTVRHGMRDFSTPSIVEPLPPYMFEPPIGYPQQVVLMDDEMLLKRSKKQNANGVPAGVIIREMESGEERMDQESPEPENRHRRRYEPNRDISKSRGRKHEHSKTEQSRSRSRESHRRRSKSRERSSSDEKSHRSSQMSNGAAVTAVPGDIILATPGESEATIKRQSTKVENILPVISNHVVSKTSIVSSTGFEAENSNKSAFKTYVPKEPFEYPSKEPEPTPISDYLHPIPTSSMHFDYPPKEPEPEPATISDYTHSIPTSSIHFDYPPKEPEPEPAPISDYTHSIPTSSMHFDYTSKEPEPTPISDYTYPIQTSSQHFNYQPTEPEPSPMSDYTPHPIPTSSMHFEYPSKSTVISQTSYTPQEQVHSFGTEPDEPFNIHGSSEFVTETPSADYLGASSSEFTTGLPPVIPKEDYLPDGPASEVEHAFRFTDLEYESEGDTFDIDDKSYIKDTSNYRPPTPPFDAEASLSSLHPPPPPPPPLSNNKSAKYRSPTPPPGLIRKIPDAEGERQKILGNNQSTNKNAVIEELKRMRRRQRSSDDESSSSSPVPPPAPSAWMTEDYPTPPGSTSSQHRAVQFTVSPPEIIPREEIDSPPIEGGTFNIPPAPPPPPAPGLFLHHTKL